MFRSSSVIVILNSGRLSLYWRNEPPLHILDCLVSYSVDGGRGWGKVGMSFLLHCLYAFWYCDPYFLKQFASSPWSISIFDIRLEFDIVKTANSVCWQGMYRVCMHLCSAIKSLHIAMCDTQLTRDESREGGLQGLQPPSPNKITVDCTVVYSRLFLGRTICMFSVNH